MSKYILKSFPQSQYSFRLYYNTGKKTWQKIKQDEKCYGLINTAYFSLTKFTIDSHTMVAGKWLYAPQYHEYGICVDKAGRLSVGTEKEAVYDYTVGLPPCYIDGKKYYAYREYGKNGATFLGVSPNGDVTCLMSGKDSGMTTAECCNVLLKSGCTNIFRFDGSWSTQGSLGPGLDLDPSQERKVAIYLLIFKKNQSNSSPNSTVPSPSTGNSKIKEIQSMLNIKYSFGIQVTGVWDSASKKAMIKAVQTEINNIYGRNLAVDGSWGPASKRACPNIRKVTKNALVWCIQACLVVKGYDLSLDSSYGPACENAIKKYQKDVGLSADGICGPGTFTKLLA